MRDDTRRALLARCAESVDVCGACGQSVLTSPDDPMPTLLCDPCLGSLEARRAIRPQTIAAMPRQDGLFS